MSAYDSNLKPLKPWQMGAFAFGFAGVVALAFGLAALVHLVMPFPASEFRLVVCCLGWALVSLVSACFAHYAKRRDEATSSYLDRN
jgi:putative copper export protein